MALNFANNNSLSAITTQPSGLSSSAMTLLSTQTASSSATISFTSGIDSTYDEYVFKFINIHPSANTFFSFQTSTNGGSSYGVTVTTTFFRGQLHSADGSSETVAYDASMDLAQSTGNVYLGRPVATDNDASLSGTLKFFSPSSDTFVKHYMYNNSIISNYIQNAFGAGYFNTTSAINAVKFQFESGNIDSGVIKLYGIS
jgi:hypothetical protein